MTKKTLGVCLLSLSALLLFVGCMEEPCPVLTEFPSPPTAADVWQYHMNVVIAGEEECPVDIETFTGSVMFFEESTGIATTTGQSHAGYYPTESLEQDIQAWQAWYEQNKDHLMWNREDGTVVAVPKN